MRAKHVPTKINEKIRRIIVENYIDIERNRDRRDDNSEIFLLLQSVKTILLNTSQLNNQRFVAHVVAGDKGNDYKPHSTSDFSRSG